MTTTATKTLVNASWTKERVQQETAETFAQHMATTMNVLCKLGHEVVEQHSKASTEAKVAHYKKLGVKTPIELVTAMAEYETNVMGSKIKVWGDDKQASMEYEVCACYNAMNKIGAINEKNSAEMGKGWETCMNATAKAFGFSKAEIKFGATPTDPTIVTIIK